MINSDGEQDAEEKDLDIIVIFIQQRKITPNTEVGA
jgi:hypothetical protein